MGSSNKHSTQGGPAVGPRLHRRASRTRQDQVADLMSLAAAGDAKAFVAAYDALAPRVYAMARWLVSDRERAQAAAQRAFADMWRTASRCPPDAATGWAMAIAARHALEDAAETLPERGDHARRVLLELAEPQRMSILLTRFGQVTIGQLAQVLGVTSGSAAVLLREGLLRMGEPAD